MFLHTTHANGQTSEIPVSDEHTLTVRDADGLVVAAVSFSGVTGFALADTSLYEVAEEPAAETDAVAAKPKPAVKPRRSKK